jgi:hypothetical protein
VNPVKKETAVTPTRQWPRFSNLKDLSVTYEGRSEVFAIHPPDISPAGMFINTTANFPEGTVLKVQFRLAKSDHPIDVRCEVRYCLPGVGVGIEFLNLPLRDQKAIRDEIRIPAKKRARRKK